MEQASPHTEETGVCENNAGNHGGAEPDSICIGEMPTLNKQFYIRAQEGISDIWMRTDLKDRETEEKLLQV